jgi:hypothetical protein
LLHVQSLLLEHADGGWTQATRFAAWLRASAEPREARRARQVSPQRAKREHQKSKTGTGNKRK